MKRNYSTLTFNQLTENLPFIKVFWNDEVIYDDDLYDKKDHYIKMLGEKNGLAFWKSITGPDGLKYITKEYGDRIVYKMILTPIDGHHCVIEIEGDDY